MARYRTRNLLYIEELKLAALLQPAKNFYSFLSSVENEPSGLMATPIDWLLVASLKLNKTIPKVSMDFHIIHGLAR